MTEENYKYRTNPMFLRNQSFYMIINLKIYGTIRINMLKSYRSTKLYLYRISVCILK